MGLVSKTSKDSYSNKETNRRRDEALKRALNTPPKPRKESVATGKGAAQPKKIVRPKRTSRAAKE